MKTAGEELIDLLDEVFPFNEQQPELRPMLLTFPKLATENIEIKLPGWNNAKVFAGRQLVERFKVLNWPFKDDIDLCLSRNFDYKHDIMIDDVMLYGAWQVSRTVFANTGEDVSDVSEIMCDRFEVDNDRRY